MPVTLITGATATPIHKQLKAQGVKHATAKLLDPCQKDADAITRLRIRGILTESEGARATRRLIKSICETLES